MPIDYKKYPADWGERRKRILKRAKDKCEKCGVENYVVGYRDRDGSFIPTLNEPDKELGIFRIVLTVAHLDHDETNVNVKDERLAAWCQRCHLLYDVPEKKRRRFDKKAISRFF